MKEILSFHSKEEEGEVEENENENEEDGETKEKREAASGPWHGSQQSSHPGLFVFTDFDYFLITVKGR